jgi:general secretion pathway protein G
MIKVKGSKGFTLIEVIVVAGIIAILAGILVPMILNQIDEARLSKAAGDVRSIYAAIVVFKKDTAQWPVMDANCDPNVTLLTGDGNQPTNLAVMGFDAGVTSSYNDHLVTDTNGCYNNWKGTYIAGVTADPWGNTYITNADGFSVAGREVWIMSAGPNGLIDTPVPNLFGAALVGDDIGLRIK